MRSYNFCGLWSYALTLSLSSFQFGYSMSVLNPVSKVLYAAYLRHNSSVWTAHNYDLLDVIISTAVPVGATLGAISGHCFAKKGRLFALLIANIFPLVGTIMTLFISVPLLISGRLIVGYGVGIYTFLIPTMLNEISPP